MFYVNYISKKKVSMKLVAERWHVTLQHWRLLPGVPVFLSHPQWIKHKESSMQLAPNNVCGSCISVPYIAVWKMNPFSASKEQAEGFLSFSATHFYLDTHLHSFLYTCVEFGTLLLLHLG